MKQFIFGPVLGGLVGWLGGMLVEKASKIGWMNTTFQRLAGYSLAILALAWPSSSTETALSPRFSEGLCWRAYA